MKHLILFLLWVASACAAAETIEERIDLAQAAEDAPDTKFYNKVMFDAVGKHLADTMRTCFAKTTDPDKQDFVIVADLSPQGKAMDVVVRPSTNIAVCFSEGFASAEFPAPPKFQERATFPVYIQMRIKQ